MKKSVVLSVVIAVLSMILIINCAPVEQQTAAITQSQIRAVKGDTVWVIINYVKADKQEDYERFHNDYFYPIIDEITDQDEKKQIDCIRVLHPLALGSSGNYTYVLMMDPLFVVGPTTYLPYLKKRYTDEEAEEHMKLFRESLARGQEGFRFIETDIGSTGKSFRAAENDAVRLIFNTIKPGKEADFEKLVFDLVWKVQELEKNPVHSKIFTHTRFLTPLQPNNDGSSTYLFIMDPLVAGAHYNWMTIWGKYYTEEQAAEYLAIYNDCIQKPARYLNKWQTKH